MAAAAHGFVALYLGLAAVVGVDGACHERLYRLGSTVPDPLRIALPTVELGAHHHQHRRVGDLRLVPGHFTQLHAQLRIADLDQPHVLQVEGGRRMQRQVQEMVLLFASQAEG